jgi:metal-responsive CopG/Arc/MetJ family transcriptional regulator
MAKVLISMKTEFLDEIDKVAENEHRSRSELIREALRHYIKVHQKSRLDTTQIDSHAERLASLLFD